MWLRDDEVEDRFVEIIDEPESVPPPPPPYPPPPPSFEPFDDVDDEDDEEIFDRRIESELFCMLAFVLNDEVIAKCWWPLFDRGSGGGGGSGSWDLLPNWWFSIPNRLVFSKFPFELPRFILRFGTGGSLLVNTSDFENNIKKKS